jgi:hypothetical protein
MDRGAVTAMTTADLAERQKKAATDMQKKFASHLVRRLLDKAQRSQTLSSALTIRNLVTSYFLYNRDAAMYVQQWSGAQFAQVATSATTMAQHQGYRVVISYDSTVAPAVFRITR